MSEAQKTLFTYVQTDTNLEQAVLQIAQEKHTFTADDLHTLEPLIIRLHRDKRVLGAVLASLEKKGKIRKVKYVKSRRQKCHGRPVLTWTVSEKEK